MTRNSPASQTTQEPRSSNDLFSADRMNPGAIARGAMIENRNAVSEISQRTWMSKKPTRYLPSTSTTAGRRSRLPQVGRIPKVFPFAPQSFAAVVYRFPVAAPEVHYRSILTEARRVLKPGGFIELSILDVDLNNMGNRGRRTVRRLKERINEKTPDTSLGSTADLIIRLLGKVGFTTIKAARVGVPVASSGTRSDSKADKGKATAEKKKDPLADEGITKMNPSGKRIWSDKPLLSESEELGTSLKLMVCCAQAPLERITSV
ncbi:hypothetical protein FAGAP_8343 [Fusarium agapanthi]|uniref:Methyltransferase type 11 domain-containing protein n=1 Tax=Fusarium agapanthi TaxID=1803897 RepID=A0A9P5B654_9HYPO|nr:hypothetical protein FAGAP_8343 [Fusarium agapanthi]